MRLLMISFKSWVTNSQVPKGLESFRGLRYCTATLIYFRKSFLVTLGGLALGAYLGWRTNHSWTGALSTMFIVAVLATLEVSLSFDNAVVNAAVLTKMSPL
jgi:hypothetical protein